MEKKEIDILTGDLEVPKEVQKKADAAFARIKKERTERMKNQNQKKEKGPKGIFWFAKPVMAAAALLVLCTGIAVGGQKKISLPITGTEHNEVQSRAGTESAASVGNWFTMTAYAKELEPGMPVPVTNVGSSGRSYVLNGTEDGTVSYCISTEFLCRGENIERVSYSVNKGAFQIVQPKDYDSSIILDGEPFLGELDAGSIGGGWDEIREQTVFYETFLYQSFTLDYDRQSDNNTWINICNVIPGREDVLEQIWGEGEEAEAPARMTEGVNEMLKGTVITCTAHYTDGTSQSVDIEVNSRLMTYKEAGEPSGEGEISRDTKAMFITFEVK